MRHVGHHRDRGGLDSPPPSAGANPTRPPPPPDFDGPPGERPHATAAALHHCSRSPRHRDLPMRYLPSRSRGSRHGPRPPQRPTPPIRPHPQHPLPTSHTECGVDDHEPTASLPWPFLYSRAQCDLRFYSLMFPWVAEPSACGVYSVDGDLEGALLLVEDVDRNPADGRRV